MHTSWTCGTMAFLGSAASRLIPLRPRPHPPPPYQPASRVFAPVPGGRFAQISDISRYFRASRQRPGRRDGAARQAETSDLGLFRVVGDDGRPGNWEFFPAARFFEKWPKRCAGLTGRSRTARTGPGCSRFRSAARRAEQEQSFQSESRRFRHQPLRPAPGARLERRCALNVRKSASTATVSDGKPG
jgi:hypothetical protein